MDWLDLIAVQQTLKSLLQHHSSKESIFWRSAFFTVQPSHPYMTTGKTIAFTRQTFVGKVMSLLFNMLTRLVITFLPRSKCLLISWLQSPSAVIMEPRKIKSDTVSTVSPSISHEVIGPDAMIWVFWMLSFKPTFSLSSFTFKAILTLSKASLKHWAGRSGTSHCPLEPCCVRRSEKGGEKAGRVESSRASPFLPRPFPYLWEAVWDGQWVCQVFCLMNSFRMRNWGWCQWLQKPQVLARSFPLWSLPLCQGVTRAGCVRATAPGWRRWGPPRRCGVGEEKENTAHQNPRFKMNEAMWIFRRWTFYLSFFISC